MFDDTPWFRRWCGFSFMPTKRQGWAAILGFALIEAPLMLLWLRVEAESLAWWVLAAGAFGLFLAFWALVVWKTDTP